GSGEKTTGPVELELGAELFDPRIIVPPVLRPRGTVTQEEDQPWDAKAARLFIFEVGDALALLGVDETVAPGEDADITFAGTHVAQAILDRPLLGGRIDLHAARQVLEPDDGVDCHLSLLLQILGRRGHIDSCHTPPSALREPGLYTRRGVPTHPST